MLTGPFLATGSDKHAYYKALEWLFWSWMECKRPNRLSTAARVRLIDTGH